MKVKFFSKKVFADYCKIISFVSSVTSLIFVFDTLTEQYLKIIISFCFIILILLIYIVVYLYHKLNRKIKLKINNTYVSVSFGDIFKTDGIKVIGFNEYLDTTVDDKIISSKSLNGIVINKIGKEKIEESIKEDKTLKVVSGEYRKKYKLGSIHKIDDFFILALTHFDEKNVAYLMNNEYAECLLEMWNQLNEKYNYEKIVIPLLGSGLTRIYDDQEINDQELLEVMLTTLKISKKTFKRPSEINIILHKDKMGNFNFSRIREIFK